MKRLALASALCVVLACTSAHAPVVAEAPRSELRPAVALPLLPKGLPEVGAPLENPTTAEKAELGWMLFFDRRLSKDGSMACAACHHIDKAYTSGVALDTKVGGQPNKRNAPAMANLGFHSFYYWDGRMPSLEAVSKAAWKGQLGADPAVQANALNAVPTYRAMFERAFGGPATAETVPKALGAFLRTLHSGNSPWDRFMAGDRAALSEQAARGWSVFQKAQCNGCHIPPLFTDSDFHHVGVPGDDPGRADATKSPADRGKFKTPSLRDVALTAPYFHDGQTKTLSEAITFMVGGGSKSATVDPKLKPFDASPEDLAALEEFLRALEGERSWTKEPTLP